MACFLVPATEAVATVVITQVIKSKEKKANVNKQQEVGKMLAKSTPFSKKLTWLSNLLFGGSALLAFEHVWHGEITPWFPFLTNAATPESALTMLKEMLTVGAGMAAVITAVWGGMLLVSHLHKKHAAKTNLLKEQESN